jgi:hypothetical protein
MKLNLHRENTMRFAAGRARRGISMFRNFMLIAALILVPALARADWKYAHWGATPEQLALASGGAVKVLPAASREKHADPWNSMTAARGTHVEGDLRLDLVFSFDLKSGGLNCIVFNSAKGSSGKLLRKMFFQLYGPPQTTANHEGIGMQNFVWRTSTDQVGLTLMAEDDSSFATQCVPGGIPPPD